MYPLVLEIRCVDLKSTVSTWHAVLRRNSSTAEVAGLLADLENMETSLCIVYDIKCAFPIVYYTSYNIEAYHKLSPSTSPGSSLRGPQINGSTWHTMLRRISSITEVTGLLTGLDFVEKVSPYDI